MSTTLAPVPTAPDRPAAGLWTVEDVAAFLKCGVRSVWRLRDNGSLPPAVKLGASTRWRPDDIARWVATGCKPCSPRRAG